VADPIRVEVVYAERGRQTLIALTLPAGATVAEAIAASAIHAAHPGIPAGLRTGIFGEPAGPATVLQEGDRVELYRPLPADPKETRRRLAREGRSMGLRRG
jgi:putative ubiquitin-RnfH superfamily antitoxin RatB of RatAB toxin-antitoxin module